jgi:hypothetical protein
MSTALDQLRSIRQSNVVVGVESAEPFVCHSQRESAVAFLHTNSKSALDFGRAR